MGWSRVPIRGMQNGYNDEAKRIDEQILRLFRERKAASGGKGLFPDMETIEKWASELELEVAEITFILSNLNEARPRRHIWEEPGILLGVLPIMKTTLEGDAEYTLTHAMQYEKLSIVTLEIKYLKETVGHVHLDPRLTLSVLGAAEYEVDSHSGNGGGAHLNLQFRVAPPLPQDIGSIQLSLVPGSSRFIGPRYEEVVLEQPVAFE
ncbi:hypothetical protein [Paenibacillus sp. S150]|uniref:hypothetical protein n=1 Tax=Paenibacillus sp. S150 TaxID=2749826 RepID=UPI001C59F093|nr:hypothetical protein [Paenibacillus sp. S150]MBW4085054.1 hypothetical protein [Paenibacillus sp. S150]